MKLSDKLKSIFSFVFQAKGMGMHIDTHLEDAEEIFFKYDFKINHRDKSINLQTIIKRIETLENKNKAKTKKINENFQLIKKQKEEIENLKCCGNCGNYRNEFADCPKQSKELVYKNDIYICKNWEANKKLTNNNK